MSESPKTGRRMRVVLVRTEGELAELLEKLPNRSEFVRRALWASLLAPYPLCGGMGAVPPAVAARYRASLNPADSAAGDG